MHFSIIVAVDEKMGIGIKNDLPWHLSADLKHFAAVTKDAPAGKQNAVIMGRRTWESLPEKYRPLKGRVNVVVSSTYKQEIREYLLSLGVFGVPSFDVALEYFIEGALGSILRVGFLNIKQPNKIFVIGGATIFQQAISHPSLNEIYITRVLRTFPCDVFFPAIPASFKKMEESSVHKEQGIQFRFERWERA